MCIWRTDTQTRGYNYIDITLNSLLRIIHNNNNNIIHIIIFYRKLLAAVENVLYVYTNGTYL